MSNMISRRELYAHGEPLGDSVTRKKLGGGYICGFGGSSKSSAATTTNNVDRRNAVQNGIGISGDGNMMDMSTSNMFVNDTRTNWDWNMDASTSTSTSNSGNWDWLTQTDSSTNTSNSGNWDWLTQTDSSTNTSNSGNTSNSNSHNTTVTDGGIVSRALDSIDKADAIQGQGFADLLQAAGDIYAKGQTTLNMAGDRIADAWQSASTEKAGTIDNKTIIALAVAGVVAAALISGKK